MQDLELGYLLALVRFPKFGSVRIGKLRNYFSSMEAAFHASREDLLRASIESPVVESFLSSRSNLNPKAELQLLRNHGVSAIPFDDPSYPPLLKQIFDPPAILFVRGRLPDPALPHLAVVGSRKHTSYGQIVVEDIVRPLAKHAVIVSGLAIGIDALAHKAALDGEGTTVAVLACGVDQISPSQNRTLGHEIIARGGAIISEFPIGTHVLKQKFPFRNRIIAGLAHGTLIIEAAEKSGTLITARCAMEHNRDVFAVPGPITSKTSVGANALIKDGAIPVLEPNDVLEVLGVQTQPPGQNPYIPTSDSQQAIFHLLTNEPIHIDELARQTKLPTSEILSALTTMEMNGGARHVGGSFYVKAPSKT